MYRKQHFHFIHMTMSKFIIALNNNLKKIYPIGYLNEGSYYSAVKTPFLSTRIDKFIVTM